MDRVCHFEVPFADKQRMQNFYSKVFGWQFMDAPTEAPYLFALTTEVDEHFMPQRAGGINGGAYPRGDEGGSKSPVVVIEVPSCAQRVEEIKQAGGSLVIGPMEIAGMGIYAQVKDTEDNIIGLWQPLTNSD